jgi:hypothetical protein
VPRLCAIGFVNSIVGMIGMDRQGSVPDGREELAELRGRFELRDRVKFLERRGESVRETPKGPGIEGVMSRIEVQVVHASGKMLRRIERVFNEGVVDKALRNSNKQLSSSTGVQKRSSCRGVYCSWGERFGLIQETHGARPRGYHGRQ